MNLRTDSRALAIKRARALRVAMEHLMDLVAFAATKHEAERRVRESIDAQAAAYEINVAMTGCALLTPDEADHMGQEHATELDALLRTVSDVMVRPQLKERASRALTGRSPDDEAALEPLIAQGFVQIAPGIERESVVGRLLARTLLRGLACLVDEQNNIDHGVLSPIPKHFSPRQPAPQAATPQEEPSAPFLSHWDDFEKNKI